MSTDRQGVSSPDGGATGVAMTGPSERPAELFALDPATCRALLRTQHVGRLVTTGADARVVPVNYVVAEDMVVFRRSVGAGAGDELGAAVLFEADMFDERTHSGWSVVVAGRMLERPPELDTVTVETWAPGDHDRWLVVTVESLTGRLLRGKVDAPPPGSGGYL
jgi:nitroimidazol reductase NimA-like FMN-containing flavoprotein (pyridoxamine 5'-phosphate oxidase superfamily)